MFVTDSLLKNCLGVVVAIVVIVIAYFKWSFQYWRKKNLLFLEPSIPFGHFPNFFSQDENFGVKLSRIYKEMKQKKWKHGGIYTFSSPAYFPVDLEYIKNVMVKDFQYFVDRGIYVDEKRDPLSGHLFALGGNKWRNLRAKLTPTFTSGKMKMMFQTLIDCQKGLLEKMDEHVGRKESIDIKDVMACYTTDVIGSCAFGLDCHTFEMKNSPFRVFGKRIFSSTKRELLTRFVALSLPGLARFLKVKITAQEVEDFFMTLVKDTVEYRQNTNSTRKDFIQLLIDLKNDEKSLTIEEMAAQMFVFFLAGFETSSSTMAFALYELARNPLIQQTVRDEINGIDITYEAIHNLKYLDQVINETLRKYPPAPQLIRRCVKDYKVPDQNLVIEKGTSVMISALGIHYDPEYYPDPDKFDPDRFTEENKKRRPHFAHIPFGEGPRICIGMRFGLMQTKVGLTALLRRYKFTINNKTREPFTFEAKQLVLSPVGGIWLNADRI